VTFRILYCFIVLRHDRRRVDHFNATLHPTARWTAQQVLDGFPFDEAQRFLIRDRDSIYGVDFIRPIKHMGVEEFVIAFRSLWQDTACYGLSGNSDISFERPGERVHR
jgi:hypothetical protein